MLSKSKVFFECNNCSHRVIKWVGCCPGCKAWNSINEKVTTPAKKLVNHLSAEIQKLELNNSIEFARTKTHLKEWDRVLGGGIVQGSISVLTGDPGIGKSTLLLQVVHNLAKEQKAIYFSSEESAHQVSNRAQRILGQNSEIYFLAENNLETIIATVKQAQPKIVVLDSIQNCFLEQSQTSAGSISQLRECGFALMQLAKENNITIILTAHITKEGQMAGPKTLEHMVDAVFYLQGEDRWQIRVLRSVKNRFGPVNELGFFEMSANGMQEVPDINELLIGGLSNAPGSTLISYLEGSRPLLLELQALTLPSKLNMPQRVITGLDHKHVILIAAILEKYLKIKFSNQDIFFKISGGFKVKNQSADLGIALALLSSYLQKPLPAKTIALGELSLTGKIKPVSQLSAHIKEAERFGIEQIIFPKGLKVNTSAIAHEVSSVFELLNFFDN